MTERPVVVGIGELLWDMLPTGREMGGAPANFAYHARSLGAAGVPVSRVGADDLGREILRRLGERGLDAGYVSVDPDRPTGTVTVELDAAGEPAFTIHRDVAWDHITATPGQAELARRAAAVCFGTLARRSPVSRATIERFLDGTREECLRVFDVNLRQDYFDAELLRSGLDRCGILKLNDEELPVVGKLLGFPSPEREAVEGLMEEFDLDLVALTRGENGAALFGRTGSVERPAAPPGEVVSTVGAGDAFTAAVVMGLLRGEAPGAICEKANRLAAYVCSQAGAMPEIPLELR